MKPAETTILDEVAARLANISEANGYSRDFCTIRRQTQTPPKSGHIPDINYWTVGHEVAEDQSYSCDNHALTIFIAPRDKTRDEAFSDEAANMIADVATALNRATTAPKVSDAESFALGETVSDLIVRDSRYQVGQGQIPFNGALMEIEITYKSPRGDMFTYEP